MTQREKNSYQGGKRHFTDQKYQGVQGMRREQQRLGGGSTELCYQIVSARDEERAANTRRMEHRVVLPDSKCKG